MSSNDFLGNWRRSNVNVTCRAMKLLICHTVDLRILRDEELLVAFGAVLFELQLEAIAIFEIRCDHDGSSVCG